MVWGPSIISNAVNLSIELQNSIDETRLNKLNKIIAKLEQRINSHDMRIRELNACNQLIDKNLNLINDLSGIKSDQLKDEKARISKLFSDIKVQAQEQMAKESALATSLASPGSAEPILNFAFFCENDGEDHNGAIIGNMTAAMHENIPFVASKSIICGTALKESDKHLYDLVRRLIFYNHKDWSIYEKGEYVVFIPKSYPFKAEELDFDVKAEELLNFDVSYDKIAQVLERLPRGKAKIEDFISLFKPNGQVKKRLILNGHGTVGCIGALDLEHYRKLLEFLETSHCESLEIQSCRAGSINAIEHYFDIIKTQTDNRPEIKKRIFPSFPISMRSIGDFNTETFFQCRSKAYSTYFEYLNKWLHEKGIATIPKFKKMLKEIYKSRYCTKPELFNSMQVKFPYQYDAPGGFRPVGEDPSMQIITYTSLRKAEIEKTEAIHVDNKEYIEILPSEVSIPIKISQKLSKQSTYDYNNAVTGSDYKKNLSEAPILLSMIPGAAHHLIHQMTADGFTLDDLFVSNAKIYAKSNSEKSFFIGKMDFKDAKSNQHSTASKIIFHFVPGFFDFAPATAHMYYASGSPEQFWHVEFDIEKGKLSQNEISENEFYFATLEAAKRSIPNEEALRSATGGQEDDMMFMNSLFHHVFWQTGPHLLPGDYDLYDKYRKNPSKEQAAALCKNLKPESKQFILFDAILNNYTDLATLLIPSPHIDVNKKSLGGQTLLFLASIRGKGEWVKQLIDRGADLNAPSLPNNKTPLLGAVQSKHPAVVKIILDKFEQVDFSAKDSLGWTALQLASGSSLKSFSYAIKEQLDRKHLTGRALQKAFEEHLNHINDQGLTALSYKTLQGKKIDIESWLKDGADPYLGKPSAMSQAILAGNKEMVEFWLEKDYDVLKPDSEGKTALEYAFKQDNPEILSHILKKLICEENKDQHKVIMEIFVQCLRDSSLELGKGFEKQLNLFGNYFLNKAYKASRPEWIVLLLQAGANPTKSTSEVSFLHTLILQNDLESLKVCLKNTKGLDLNTSSEALLRDAYIINPQMLEPLLQAGGDPAFCNEGEFPSCLEQIIAADDEKSLDLCLSFKGLDLNRKQFYRGDVGGLLLKALGNNKISMFKKMVAYGADVTLPKENMPIERLIYEAKDLELLSFCLSHIPPEVKKEILNKENYLFHALRNNNQDLFNLLLEHGAKPRNITRKTESN